jgi:hypothetical protein
MAIAPTTTPAEAGGQCRVLGYGGEVHGHGGPVDADIVEQAHRYHGARTDSAFSIKHDAVHKKLHLSWHDALTLS